MNEHNYPINIKNWLDKFKCVYCGKFYKRCKIIGQLQCCKHTKGFINNKWACCNNDIYHKGCIKIDHSDKTDKLWYIFQLPDINYLFKVLKSIKRPVPDASVAKKIIKKNNKIVEGYMCIRRSTEVEKEKVQGWFKKFLCHKFHIDKKLSKILTDE